MDANRTDGLPLDAGAADLLRRLEAEADDDPLDREIAARLEALADRVAAEAWAPPVVGGVLREAFVRWDRWSVTFAGTAIATGAPAMVRVLRPDAARDPVLRRHLLREGRALAEVAPVEIDAAAPALRCALPGIPLGPARGADLARVLATGLAAIARWDEAALGLPVPAPVELRRHEGRAIVACLTATVPGVRGAIGALAATAADPDDDDEGPVTLAARALALGAPDRASAAAEQLRTALAADLTARRHALARRWRDGAQASRKARLADAVARLSSAVGAPEGRGAVGVDLEGRITVLQAGPRAVVWGVDGAPEVVWDRDGFRAPVARRLLRARAASPPSAALDARVGGDAERVDAICRWVAAGLQLRTVRLLLEREAG